MTMMVSLISSGMVWVVAPWIKLYQRSNINQHKSTEMIEYKEDINISPLYHYVLYVEQCDMEGETWFTALNLIKQPKVRKLMDAKFSIEIYENESKYEMLPYVYTEDEIKVMMTLNSVTSYDTFVCFGKIEEDTIDQLLMMNNESNEVKTVDPEFSDRMYKGGILRRDR